MFLWIRRRRGVVAKRWDAFKCEFPLRAGNFEGSIYPASGWCIWTPWYEAIVAKTTKEERA